jgi:hypothetical protein
MRKRRFIVVSVLYAVVLPLIYLLLGPMAALVIGAIMLVSVLAALWLARHQTGNAVTAPKPLSEREQRIYAIARRGVLIGALISLMTWAFVWSFYWELRSYFLLPGFISCVIVALAIYGVLRPSSLSNNVMRFQMMAAFGYSLVLPVFAAWVLIARFTGIEARGTGVVFIPLSIWVGFFVQRWRERSVIVPAIS